MLMTAEYLVLYQTPEYALFVAGMLSLRFCRLVCFVFHQKLVTSHESDFVGGRGESDADMTVQAG